jgi:hypothetical protein
MVEGNGQMSLRKPKLSTTKGSSAPRRRRKFEYLKKKPIGEIQVSLKLDKNNEYFTW